MHMFFRTLSVESGSRNHALPGDGAFLVRLSIWKDSHVFCGMIRRRTGPANFGFFACVFFGFTPSVWFQRGTKRNKPPFLGVLFFESDPFHS